MMEKGKAVVVSAFSEVYDGAKDLIDSKQERSDEQYDPYLVNLLRIRVDYLDRMIETGAPDRVIAVQMKLILQLYCEMMGWCVSE